MLAIDFNDLSTQIIAAVIAGVVLLIVQPGWMRRPPSLTSSASDDALSNSRGNQMVLKDSVVRGDVNQRYTDNSRTTMITTNVNNMSDDSASRDPWAEVFIGFLVVVVTLVLFMIFWPFLRAISYGFAFAVAIMIAVAIHRTHRLRAWNARTVIAAVVTGGLVLVSLVSWMGIISTEREGISLPGVTNEIGYPAATQSASGFSGLTEFFFESALPFVLDGDRPVGFFIGSLAVGASFSVILIIFAWIRLLNWHAFLGCRKSDECSPRMTARAESFLEGWKYGLIIESALLAIVGLSFSLGYVFDLLNLLPALAA